MSFPLPSFGERLVYASGLAVFFTASVWAPEAAAHVVVFNGVQSEQESFVRKPSVARVAKDTPKKDSDPVASAMVNDFGAAGIEANPPVAGFSPPSFIRVPAWMKGSPIRKADAPRISLGAFGCGEPQYRSSAILAPSAEARRRILYPLVHEAACSAGVPVALMDAMIIQESRYNPAAVSPKGALGLGQLMPGTARLLGVNPFDIRQNLAGAARYLAQHINEFGSAALALAAYNAGPGRVRRSRSVPNIDETQDYVRSILRNWSVLVDVERY